VKISDDRTDPVTGPVRMITQAQAAGLRVLHGQLGRACPELTGLTFGEAGDLIVSLRAELLSAEGMPDR
jgi:hypothetical protein